MRRTNSCGELTKKDIGRTVVLCGWTQSRRDHGGLIFIDLRDRHGLTQIVFDPSHNKDTHKMAEHIGREFVLEIKGKIRSRKKGMINPKLKTGEIEVLVDELNILNKSDVPPLEIEENTKINEDMRLKYRYLDLRRPVMQKNILTRHIAVKAVRDFLDKNGFLEIETPILAKSTPEGARDYLVPSRVHPGKFFALPQSPQLFKQLLMVSGFDKYFQIARCFRDEDLRADRQPEFTQIDIEMSFVEENDVFELVESMIKDLWKKTLNIDVKIPFTRISHKDAMSRFGSDKPDTRFGLELIEANDLVKGSDFGVFNDIIKKGGKVKCINAKGCANFSRKDIDELTNLVQIYGANGLAWMKMNEKLESSVVKYFNDETQKKIIKGTDAKKNDLILFVADRKHFVVDAALGNLRLKLADKLGLINDNVYNFLWVLDFPLVEYDENLEKHVAVHHPFTSPKDEDLKLLEKDPAKVRAKAYDLVLNGVELGGGSIRIHNREIQEKMFNVLGIKKQEAESKFGFLLNAFKYGAPPHGGIAFGVDRIIAILTKNDSIREVIAFPKNKAAMSLMDEAPSEVDEAQLKELHIKSTLIKKK